MHISRPQIETMFAVAPEVTLYLAQKEESNPGAHVAAYYHQIPNANQAYVQVCFFESETLKNFWVNFMDGLNGLHFHLITGHVTGNTGIVHEAERLFMCGVEEIALSSCLGLGKAAIPAFIRAVANGLQVKNGMEVTDFGDDVNGEVIHTTMRVSSM